MERTRAWEKKAFREMPERFVAATRKGRKIVVEVHEEGSE
jgi:hypothetical protein